MKSSPKVDKIFIVKFYQDGTLKTVKLRAVSEEDSKAKVRYLYPMAQVVSSALKPLELDDFVPLKKPSLKEKIKAFLYKASLIFPH